MELIGRNEAERAERNHVLARLSVSSPCESMTNESQPTSNGMQFQHWQNDDEQADKGHLVTSLGKTISIIRQNDFNDHIMEEYK